MLDYRQVRQLLSEHHDLSLRLVRLQEEISRLQYILLRDRASITDAERGEMIRDRDNLKKRLPEIRMRLRSIRRDLNYSDNREVF